jgi:mono/diheme cytochrome c family protein
MATKKQELNMARKTVKWLIIANLTIGTNTVVWAQGTDLGKTLYLLGCAVCHGIDGKGKGPLSEQLKVAPADLTVLTKKNNGVFPVSSVYETIDGRKVIAAHGTREMPIWGKYDRESLYPRDKLIDPSYDPEAVVRTRTLAIIDYLNRIQEK